MKDTYGPSGPNLSRSSALQSSLENRLQARLEGLGCPLYALTWKTWDMKSGPPICALRASALPTSGNDCIGALGWPTPTAREYRDSANMSLGDAERLRIDSAPRVATLAGWITPIANDCTGSAYNYEQGKRENVRLKIIGQGKATCFAKSPSTVSELLEGWEKGLTGCFARTRPLYPRGVLYDPAHSQWLMGYPSAWGNCAP